MIRALAAVAGVTLLLLLALHFGPAVRTHPVATQLVSVAEFGVHPDDGVDDTAGLQKALDSLHGGEELTFPPGVYQHSDLLNVTVADVSIVGPGATLQATNETSSAFHIDADRVTVIGLSFSIATTTRRWDATRQHKIWISGHDGVTLTDVTVRGSAAAGIFVDGTRNFRIERATVRDTRADGIHITGGANHGLVDHATVSGTGDDGVAVVSYDKDALACTAIDVVSPRVLGTTWGRGVTIVGGSDIDYTDVYVERSNAAGIYIASEGSPWYTRSVENVTIHGGRVVGANENSDIDQGAVLVYLGRPDTHVTGVSVQGLSVEGTRPTASRNVGVVGTDGAVPADVTFSGLNIVGGPGVQYGGNTPQGSYRVVP